MGVSAPVIPELFHNIMAYNGRYEEVPMKHYFSHFFFALCGLLIAGAFYALEGKK
jgi:hypothetical protein